VPVFLLLQHHETSSSIDILTPPSIYSPRSSQGSNGAVSVPCCQSDAAPPINGNAMQIQPQELIATFTGAGRYRQKWQPQKQGSIRKWAWGCRPIDMMSQ